MLFALAWLLASSIVSFAVLHRLRRLSRPMSIAWIGLLISLAGAILTPGIAWGDFDDKPTVGAIATLVFYVGIGFLIAAAFSWHGLDVWSEQQDSAAETGLLHTSLRVGRGVGLLSRSFCR